MTNNNFTNLQIRSFRNQQYLEALIQIYTCLFKILITISKQYDKNGFLIPIWQISSSNLWIAQKITLSFANFLTFFKL